MLGRMRASSSHRLSTLRAFTLGATFLARGARLVVTTPRLFVLGLLPAMLTAALYGLGLVLFAIELPAWSAALSGFASAWAAPWPLVARTLVGLALVGLALLVTIASFTAVTLLVGEPFYEPVARAIEARFGGVPGEVDEPLHRALPGRIADSMQLVGLSLVTGAPLALGSLLPVVGQTVVPVIGALVGAWLLALELTAVPFERRGLRLRDRRVALGARRPLALGFGLSVFVVFLVPLGGIVAMPAAVAGAALLRAVRSSGCRSTRRRPAPKGEGGGGGRAVQRRWARRPHERPRPAA